MSERVPFDNLPSQSQVARLVVVDASDDEALAWLRDSDPTMAALRRRVRRYGVRR